MTDIVERLRREGVEFHEQLEAADEIRRLRERVASLQATSGYEASIAQVEIEKLRAALTDMLKHFKQYEDAECCKHVYAQARRALEPRP